jgi:hypothetical protein
LAARRVVVFLAGVDLLAVLLAVVDLVVAALVVRLAGDALLVLLFAARFVVAFAGVALAVLLEAAAFVVVLFAGVAFAADFDADFDALLVAALVAEVARLVTVLVAPTAAAAVLVAVPAEARPPAAAAFGSWRGSATTFLKAVPALNFGTVVFLIFTVSPVRGLRPVRAPRATFWNVPNPVMPTFPPRATSRMITSRTASSASLAAFLLPSFDSRAPMSSALFTFSLRRLRVGQPPDVDAAGPIPALVQTLGRFSA